MTYVNNSWTLLFCLLQNMIFFQNSKSCVPFFITIVGLSLLSWASTAALSGMEVTGTGFCDLDVAVRNYADTLESTRDAYSLVDPNIPPIQLGDVNRTNGPTPPELLEELSSALRVGINNIEGWCPSHGNAIPQESRAYDDASAVDDKRNDGTTLGASSGVDGSKLKHEPLMKFFVSVIIMVTIFPLVAVSVGYCMKSRPSFRAAMRSGTLSVSLVSLLMTVSLIIGMIESDVCPSMTNRIERDLIEGHSHHDPFILQQISNMVRCHTNTMEINATAAWEDPNDNVWASELERIRLMVARTKEEQKAQGETPSPDQTSQEKSEAAVEVNMRVRHQEALAKWLEQTMNCKAFSTAYGSFLEDVCGTGFGWFEQCAIASMLLTLLLGVGMCCVSTGEYMVEQENRRAPMKDLAEQTHSSLLGGDRSKPYWPSL